MTLSQVSTTQIDHLLRELWDREGSDLLLTAGSPPMMRVNGELHPIPGAASLTVEEAEKLVYSVLTDEVREEFEHGREADFSFSWRDLTRFRANVFHQQGAVALSLRVIPYQIPTFDELGLPPVMEYFCGLNQGLVLLTGPTGSGKSTTLASMIDLINTRRRLHILTLEDPVEYVHTHKLSVVNQREVGFDTISFARGLRSALREDPDVVLVGEMRDPESIQTTLTIAETGHLVFATLHTNDASTALDRIVDVFPSERQAQIRTQLAASLAGVVAQRLIPRYGGGMVAAFEILLANSAVRGLIREGKSHQIRNVISQSVREGMQTLEQSLSVLVTHGLISYDDALARSVVPKEIRPPAMPQAVAGTAPPAAPAGLPPHVAAEG